MFANDTTKTATITADLLPFKSDSAANEQTRKFLLGVIKICLDYIEQQNNRSEKVVEFYQPDEIMKMFDFSIPDSPLELDKLVDDCRKTLSYQVKTGKFLTREVRRLICSALTKRVSGATDRHRNVAGDSA